MLDKQWEIRHQLELLSSPTTVQYHRIDEYSSIVQGVQRVRRILADDFEGEHQRFLRACCSNDIETVKWFFAEHKINLRNGVNRSALHEAALHSNGRLLVRFLCQHGADPKQRDSLGRTPLHFAASYGHWEVLNELFYFLEVPISTLVDREGRCPLMYACGEGHLLLSQWLVQDYHADYERQDDCGRSCLTYACRNGHLEVVRWLLTILTPQSTNTGWHPLHFACAAGYLDVMKLLLQYTRNSSQVITNTGHSVLFIAMHAEKNSAPMVKYLLDADLSIQLTMQDIEDLDCDKALILLLAQRRHALHYLPKIIERLGYPLALLRLLLLSEHTYCREELLSIPPHQLFIRQHFQKPLNLKCITRCSIRKSIDTSNKIDQLPINQNLKKFLRFECLY